MRSRLLAALLPLAVFASLASLASAAQGQSQTSGDGLVPGDYIRVAAGVVSPVHPQGSLRDWDRGQNVGVEWENWQPGSSGVSNFGFGLGFEYSHLPLNESQFLSTFETVQGTTATSADASGAKLFSLTTRIRYRIPNPVVVPNISLGFGFLNYQPSTIDFTAPGGNGTTTQKHRTGGSISFGGGLDRQIYDRAAIYGEAVYTYAFTSLGEGLASPGGVCAANGCDALKNTSVGVIRGGLRIRVGQ